ncbi:MAG: alpha/beta hydrolase [Candidatus Thorarchaeota archaeon]|jgi:alpha/beta superfamily hydrolase
MRHEEIEFNAEGDRLVGILSIPTSRSHKSALILHPHPLYGGNRDDRVVRYIDQILLDLEYVTMRFDFRGANSPSEYRGIPGAIQDALAAAQVLLSETKQDSLVVLGYSFGGSVALHLASRIKTDFLVTLSASLSLAQDADESLDSLRGINCPTLMFHGDRDKMVPFHDVIALSEKLTSSKVRIVELEDGGHFYMKHLNLVGSNLSEFLNLRVDG